MAHINITGTPEEVQKATNCLKKIEIKDLRKIKFCLGLQIEHLKDKIFIHQLTCTEKVLIGFYTDKAP